MFSLDLLLKKKDKLLKELDKVSEQIAIEKIQLQESEDRNRGVGVKSSVSFDKKVRTKFQIK
ncbi:hypothetical protein CMU14_15860 [Elizabethkingia anophelis]|nr:hypothetical protein [Elizabethkingia anophelis]